MPGTPLGEISDGINQDLLTILRYACCYWVGHLCQAGHQSQMDLSDGEKVLMFLQKNILHWLEALSLMGNISEEAAMVRNFESVLTVSDTILFTITIDTILLTSH